MLIRGTLTLRLLPQFPHPNLARRRSNFRIDTPDFLVQLKQIVTHRSAVFFLLDFSFSLSLSLLGSFPNHFMYVISLLYAFSHFFRYQPSFSPVVFQILLLFLFAFDGSQYYENKEMKETSVFSGQKTEVKNKI
mmetsp:Transcript_45286/g.52058  ORF Transcript_45286/g.52058 Transcript_45286/m.52058 type:complete len:134 (-) Transcript_45286:288-689(-)